MANDYAINYDDERFKAVEAEKQDRLNEVNQTYNNMVGQTDQFYQNQINAAKDYATTQQDLQNQQTELAVNEINQAKARAEKEYQKEQRGAYADWQKESNRYGVNAEQQAAQGLRNTGYSESSQVSMYNTYQNRVATAKDSYSQAVQNYDNSIAQARLANSSKLAEIAYNALQTELELSLNGFQYKNTLLLDQINKQQSINDTYYARWQNVLGQMNTENALAESIRQYNEKMAEEQRQYNESMAENIRQYNEKMAYQKERDAVADAQWQKEYDLAKKASSSSRRRSGGGSGGTGGGTQWDNNNATTNAGNLAVLAGAIAGNAAASNKNTKTTTYQAKTSPTLSSKSATTWFNSKAGSKGLSATQLANIITEGLNNKKIKDSDVAKIKKAYGLS